MRNSRLRTRHAGECTSAYEFYLTRKPVLRARTPTRNGRLARDLYQAECRGGSHTTHPPGQDSDGSERVLGKFWYTRRTWTRAYEQRRSTHSDRASDTQSVTTCYCARLVHRSGGGGSGRAAPSRAPAGRAVREEVHRRTPTSSRGSSCLAAFAACSTLHLAAVRTCSTDRSTRSGIAQMVYTLNAMGRYEEAG